MPNEAVIGILDDKAIRKHIPALMLMVTVDIVHALVHHLKEIPHFSVQEL